ncbi:tRNA-Thr(GGU) m(6)t(6)A37 methyltransferase TsaA [candidate division WOR_3 bacterium SM23_60]|uniref:tRNA-Thr(GGU) m(6)t(6)A37 methyltransferase TsaA n=1 Tax=candidate division WOR_3 bacterium SM23_60 TaxID=1703780 RepID=A0A0S8GDU0_UNCW3|nr:MAG: tRNA-Thr(GGU) m(6)t(6)A37 methyltransferase TsaA [candidate division WOR_3 bacterium SM23_60]
MKGKPIGVIHTPFTGKKETPIQPVKSRSTGRVEVFKHYADGLRDITGFSHIILIYAFHKSRGYTLRVKPFLDERQRGLFATRYPRRPNQIGLTTVQLLRKKGNTLYVRGIDVIDGTPLLDIKPYVPDFSPKKKIRIGWLTGRIQ